MLKPRLIEFKFIAVVVWFFYNLCLQLVGFFYNRKESFATSFVYTGSLNLNDAFTNFDFVRVAHRTQAVWESFAVPMAVANGLESVKFSILKEKPLQEI
jgi:hypothetical protein